MKDEILIVGTGALATLFAARLSEACLAVVMLGTWKHGLEALRQRGARLVDAKGRERVYAVRVTDDPLQVAGAKQALVLVKSWQTERVARQLKECLSAEGVALTLQNGLGNREKLAHELGFDRVAQGTTTSGATLLGPGLVRAGGEGILSIERHRAIGRLEDALRTAGFNLQMVEDACSLIWGKLVVNAAINPLTALLRIPNGELLARTNARDVMASLAWEAANVAGAEEIRLPFEDPVNAVEQVARRTASNHSSMLQDVRRGAPTEIDAICGEITRHAEKHGISTPYNKACWQLVRAAVN